LLKYFSPGMHRSPITFENTEVVNTFRTVITLSEGTIHLIVI
jgi:hypothetical protein